MRKTLTILLLLVLPNILLAADGKPVRIGLVGDGPVAEATGGGFTVFLPIVGTAVGSTTFYTSIDISNATGRSVPVTYFFFNTGATLQKSGSFVTLRPYETLHEDDLIQYMLNRGFFTPAEVGSPANLFGTLYLTFEDATFTQGNEASAVARVYNYQSGNSGPTFGLAYRAEVLRDGGGDTVRSVIRNTVGSSITGPPVRTNIAFQNKIIDANGMTTTAPITIQVSYYDSATGSLVRQDTVGPLGPGQSGGTIGTNGLGLPAGSILVIAKRISGTAQFSGWVSVLDDATKDGSFFLMQ